MKVARFLIGGMLGLLVGAIFGFVAVAWWTSRSFSVRVAGQSVGWDPISLLHDPTLLSIVLFCAVGFASLVGFLFSRIGTRKSHASHL